MTVAPQNFPQQSVQDVEEERNSFLDEMPETTVSPTDLCLNLSKDLPDIHRMRLCLRLYQGLPDSFKSQFVQAIDDGDSVN